MLKKIITLWVFLLAVGALLLNAVPHMDYEAVSAISQAIMLLMAIISFFIFRSEPNPRNKPLFLNFCILFGCSIIHFVSPFVGMGVFASDPLASVFYYQYAAMGLFFFLFAFAIVYAVIDTIFNEFKTRSKYLLTIVIVGGVFGYYYHPYFTDPRYLYKTEEISDYKEVSRTVAGLREQGITNPTVEQIAAAASLHAWKEGEKVGTLFEEQKIRRVQQLLPYLEGSNWLTLIYVPLHLNVIYMNVLCVIFIFLFFGYQYKNDPPQGAYIEKIIFLFLPYCSLEIVHFFGYIKSVEHAAYMDAYRVGQYLTILNLVLLLIFFSLRLRFITSVKGEFYERELVSDSEHISRWRDAIDSLVVRHFLNPQTLHGRFFAPRPPREKT